jgi:tripartite-type tricarboxylate transporter receptor subunit TctC
MRRTFLKQAVALTATAAVPSVFAQEGAFPTRPITVIVAFGAGGSVDPSIRVLQSKLSAMLGQPLIIENRPGGSTSIACNTVKASAADAYTLLLTTGGGHATHTIDRPEFKYDPIKDFGAVATLTRSSWAFVVNPAVPAKTISEYVSYARANPGKISYSSSGVGLLNHLAMERFNIAAGITAVNVPYKDTGTAVIDLVSGRIQAAFTARSGFQPQIDVGAVRALAYTATRPGEFGPEYSFASAGFPQIDDTDTINVLLGPAHMPPAAVARLSAAIQKALAMPDVQAQFATLEQAAFYLNPEQTTARMISEHDKYLAIIRAAHIKMGG